jgi:tRNA(fMet)-specific endonuclease VapC
MLYLLDTSTVIDLVRRPASPVGERVRRHPPAHIGVSSVVLHELYYGAFRSQRPDHHLSILDRLLFPVAEFDREDAREAGRIRASLAARGSPIGPYDALIAGQARARGLVLVTANAGEFRRVEGLVSENWSRGPA